LNATLPALPDAQAVTNSVQSWADANPRLAALLAQGTPTGLALTRWSMELLRSNRVPDAIVVMRAALALNPGEPLLWTNYGAALNQQNLTADAAACLQHSVGLSRRQPDTWLLLGMARKKLGDLTAAEEAYRIAIEQDPKSPVAWQVLGLLKQEQRDYSGAVDCLKACIKIGGGDAALLANLGKLCYQIGRFPEAHDAYRRAAGLDMANLHYRRMNRRSGFLRAMIQNQPVDAAITDFRNSFSFEDREPERELEEWFGSAFSVLSGFGHLEAAARVGHKRLELWPANPSVTYLLKAVTGDAAVDRSPPEYVVEHFDSFAEGFDAQLVGALGYDIPQKLFAAVRKHAAAGQQYEALDAGCGTGLCAPLFKPICRTLVGVDLSPKMLEQAQQRNIYDQLICEDLLTFLLRSPAAHDLVIAADILIYFGDLTAILAATAAALRPGGLFAFSTESRPGSGYRIQPSGRFAHAAEYVRNLAAKQFEPVDFIETTIRLEASHRLPGNIFILRRR
jgi:predicted TPR repeat methyltransferase